MIPCEEFEVPCFYEDLRFTVLSYIEGKPEVSDNPHFAGDMGHVYVRVCANLYGLGVGVEIKRDLDYICFYSAMRDLRKAIKKDLPRLKAAEAVRETSLYWHKYRLAHPDFTGP